MSKTWQFILSQIIPIIAICIIGCSAADEGLVKISGACFAVAMMWSAILITLVVVPNEEGK